MQAYAVDTGDAKCMLSVLFSWVLQPEIDMAVKTLTIDMDAYGLLLAEKRGGESFSKVIKRRMGHTHTAANLLRDVDGLLLATDTLDSIDELVARRDESPSNSPVWDSQ